MKRPEKLPSEFLQDGWCQGSNAMDMDGIPVSANSSAACQWCIEGAVQAAGLNVGNQKIIRDQFSQEADIDTEFWTHLTELIQYEEILNKERTYIPYQWNDQSERTQDEVISMTKQVERQMGWQN